MCVRGLDRYKTDSDYEEMLDSEDEGSEGDLVEVDEEIINHGQIDGNAVALLQKQDLIETARQMKKEVKFNNLDNVPEIIEVGNSRIILPKI